MRHKLPVSTTTLAALCLLLLWAPAASADIYAGLSAEGVPVFSDRPADGLLLLPETRDISGAPMARPTNQAGMRRYARQVELAATEQGLDPALVHAVVQVESGYDALAVSPRGARGLMQLMPATASRLGVADSFDPAANLRGGTRYLRMLIKAFDNDLPLALAAYNAGEGAVRRHAMRIPPYRETILYVAAVMRRYQALKELNT
jgi:soluble lytic murein transglycosylase-like protein